MASAFLSASMVMRLELLLLNTNFYRQFGRGSEQDRTSAEAVADMVTVGSPLLDALVFREMCPYLYKISAQPLFADRAACTLERPSQAGSPMLCALNETLLGNIFAYLTEEDLARSASQVCVQFRCSIASKRHMEVLLGKALSHNPAEAFTLAMWSLSSSTTFCLNRLGALAKALSQAEVEFRRARPEALDAENPRLVDLEVTKLFRSAPRCGERLDHLGFVFSAKRMLVEEKTNMRRFLSSLRSLISPSSTGRKVLLQLLGALKSYGQIFGIEFEVDQSNNPSLESDETEADDIQTDSESHNGFSFEPLYFLDDIRSRFHKPFNSTVAILLHLLEKGSVSPNDLKKGLKDVESGLNKLCSSGNTHELTILDQTRGVVNSIAERRHRVSVLRDTTSDDDERSFYHRLSHVLQFLQTPCQELHTMMDMAQDDVQKILAWMFPRRSTRDNPTAMAPVSARDTNVEIKRLLGFVQQCIDLLERPSTESCFAIRELAIATTAMEVAAVAKNASQKSITRHSSALAGPISKGFVQARSAVARTLDTVEIVKQERTARMSLVEKEAISSEERLRRREALAQSLQLRLPPSESVILSGFTEETKVDSEDTQEESQTLHLERDGEEDQNASAMTDEQYYEQSSAANLGVDCEQPNEQSEHALLAASDHESPRHSEPRHQPKPSYQKKQHPLVDFASTKMWAWKPFTTFGASHIWSDLNQDASLTVPLDEEEIRLLQRLFSRGPEVALTVTESHQQLRHFTSEDFSNAHSKKRDQSTALLDTARTIRAVEKVPLVVRVRELQSDASPPVSSPIVAKNVATTEEDASDPPVILPLERILQLKQEGKLTTIGLRPHLLETNLSDDEFEKTLKMSRDAFKQLAKWKRDSLKKAAGLF